MLLLIPADVSITESDTSSVSEFYSYSDNWDSSMWLKFLGFFFSFCKNAHIGKHFHNRCYSFITSCVPKHTSQDVASRSGMTDLDDSQPRERANMRLPSTWPRWKSLEAYMDISSYPTLVQVKQLLRVHQMIESKCFSLSCHNILCPQRWGKHLSAEFIHDCLSYECLPLFLSLAFL